MVVVARSIKTLEAILRGTADANIRFTDLCRLLANLGFTERIRGDHHIFTREGVSEIINIQPRGGKAKPYQVKQVRQLIIAYGAQRWLTDG
jgi:HicA toxin of bacterial toxin-antitoxin,